MKAFVWYDDISWFFLPNDFGNGIIIPLTCIKDKAGDINDSNNYRGTYLNSGYIESL